MLWQGQRGLMMVQKWCQAISCYSRRGLCQKKLLPAVCLPAHQRKLLLSSQHSAAARQHLSAHVCVISIQQTAASTQSSKPTSLFSIPLKTSLYCRRRVWWISSRTKLIEWRDWKKRNPWHKLCLVISIIKTW